MKFMVTFPLTAETFKLRTARFLETGGMPPQGVKMLGRWHAADQSQGFVLAETDDAKALCKWVTEWADLIEFEVVPILDDEEAASVLQEVKL